MENNWVMREELIGNEIEITDSKNPTLIGLMGKIINETKNTITIKTHQDKIKKIIKKEITFIIKIKGEKHTIKGKQITFRPEDRTKRI